jgi:predicted cupin superfamily sugar epimerase
MHPRASDLISTLDLRPHPEGGYYREVHRSASVVTTTDARGERSAITTIYFLLVAGAASRWHRVDSDEVWHFYEGDPLELLELDANAMTLARHRLGPVGGMLQRPVCTIPAGAWQAARSLGDYTLVGCSVGPGFDFADFRMLAADATLANVVQRAWPDVASLV